METLKAFIKVYLIVTIAVALGGLIYLATPEDLVQVVTKKTMNKEPISIGFIGVLSGDGSSYGLPIKDAISMAVAEINDTGGINGRDLKIIYEDAKCDNKEATIVTQKLINVDGVKVILGGLCSGETIAAAPIAESNKVILFSYGSSSPDITNAGDYVFRNFPSDATSGNKMAELAYKKGWKKVALLVESTDYAQAIKNVFVNRFETLGGEILLDESFTSDSTDFKTQITKIKAANPDVLYFLPQTPESGLVGLKQIREQGIEAKIFSNELISSAELIETEGLVEGAFYAEPAFDDNQALAQQFLNKYNAKFGNDYDLPAFYLASGYDAVYIIKEQLEKYGENPDKIKAGLYQIKNRSGASGNLTIDKNGDPVFEYVVKMIEDGKVIDYVE